MCPGPCQSLLPHFLVHFPLLVLPQPHWPLCPCEYMSSDLGFLCYLFPFPSDFDMTGLPCHLDFKANVTHIEKKNVFFMIFMTICYCFDYFVYFFMIYLPVLGSKFHWNKDFIKFNAVFSTIRMVSSM